MKHKVFFWLLIRDRLNTRDILRRRNMELDSYTCDMCILQKTETVAHLFLRCNFAKACWASIGAAVITTRPVLNIFNQIKEKLQVPFFMEIIIIMSWSIWLSRNDLIFRGTNASLASCLTTFVELVSLNLLRAKDSLASVLSLWLEQFKSQLVPLGLSFS